MATTMEEITKEYVCYDGQVDYCSKVDNMSDEEVEEEFQKRFGNLFETKN